MARRGTLAPDMGLVAALTCAILLFYTSFDPDYMRAGALFPWDSGIYRTLAEQIYAAPAAGIQAPYPFGPRLLFPALYGGVHHWLGLGYVDSAHLVNGVSTLLLALFTFGFWRKNGISRPTSWVGIVIFLLYWNGPARYSGYYPGGGFAFETLVVALLFMSLAGLARGGIAVPASLVAILVLGIGRELMFYIVLLLVVSKLLAGAFAHPREPGWLRSLRARSPQLLLAALAAAAAGHGIARWVVADSTPGAYSTLGTVFEYAWFHLHAVEFVYTFVYALGPFLAGLVFVMLIRPVRARYFERVSSDIADLDLVLVFALAGVVLSSVGGTDADRFVLWFFPFFGLLALKAIDLIVELPQARWRVSLVLLGTAGLLWTRFYVPAVPPAFFEVSADGKSVSRKTNYDPALYYGPASLRRYRLDCQPVPSGSQALSRPEAGAAPEAAGASAVAFVPPPAAQGTRQFPSAYRLSLNHIPIPFGFAHNQFETLVAHPVFGNTKVKLIFLGQWLALIGTLILLVRWPDQRLTGKLHHFIDTRA